MTLGEYIRQYRKEHDDMSYRAFASLVGLSPQYVINLESGINNDGKPVSPTMATYTKIANGTGISQADLLNMVNDEVEVNPDISEKKKKLINMISSLSESEADLLLSAIKDGKLHQ